MKKYLLTICTLIISMSLLAQEQLVSIHRSNAKLSMIIADIEKQTPFLFGIDEGVNLKMRVKVNVDNLPVRLFLDSLCTGTGIKYEFSDSHIFLSKIPDKTKRGRRAPSDNTIKPMLSYEQTLQSANVYDSLDRASIYYDNNPFSSFVGQMKYDFSRDGMKNWKLEVNPSSYVNLTAFSGGGYGSSIGIRLDEYRTWGLGIGKETRVNGNMQKFESIPVYLFGRHYFNIGKNLSIISDILTGAIFNQNNSAADLFLKTGSGLDYQIGSSFHISGGIYIFQTPGFFIGITL